MGFEIGRLPTTDEELFWLVKAMWGVTIPTVAVCPDHVSPMTAFADAYFNRNSLAPESGVNSIALWHGSRGLSGKSYMLAILGLTKAVLLGNDVNLLGGSFEQSKNIHTHMRNAWDWVESPHYMIAKDGSVEVRLTNGAVIHPLTASQRTVRGPHPPFLLLDEIDEMDIEILNAALGQPLPQENYLGQMVKPYTVMCSTWQNPDGTFTEILKRSEEENIPKYTWCYRETSNPVDGWLTQESIEEKKASIPRQMWDVEYELGEPSIGNRAFDSAAVERAWSQSVEPVFKKIGKDYEEFRFEEAIDDAVYVAGADWAKEQDYTVIAVGRVDVHPMRIVYYCRFNRLPYPVMIKKFNDAIFEYHAEGEHDRTGLGNVINDLIDFRVRGFIMAGEKRAAMLSEYVAAIERDRWRFPKELKTAYTEHKFAQVGDLYSNAQEYHLPDTVCAFGLMEHVAKRLAPPASPLVVKKDEDYQNRIQKVFEPRRDGTVEVRDQDPAGGFSLMV